MKYTPTMMDELNKEKARELQPTAGETAGSFVPIVALVVFGIIGLASNNPLMWFLYLVAWGVYLWWSKHEGSKSDIGNRMDEAFESYFYYATRREIDYYSMCPGQQYKVCVKLAWDAVQPPLFEPKPIDNDPWKAKFITLHRMQPENYVSMLPNDTYDYTQYFVELAYRFMVACYRLNIGDATICNFFETMAHNFWGIEQSKYATKSELPYSPHLPFVKYPIDPAQQFEICHFDYRQVDQKYGWTWKVWRMAEERFKKEKSQRYEKFPYDAMELKEFDRIANNKVLWEAGKNDAHFIVQKRMMREEFSKVWLKK